MTILTPPGNYTVKLSVDGQEFSQSLTVLKDPNTGASDADIHKQMAMLFDVRKDLESVADMVNQIEIIRAQLGTLKPLLRGADLVRLADELEKKFTDIEDNLIQRRFTGQGQDTVRWPPKLISKLNYLGNGVASGDFPPNQQQQEVHAMFKSQLAGLRKSLDETISQDLGGFNRMLRDRNIPNVIAVGQ